MKIETQTHADLAHIAEMIQDASIAMLTTIAADGSLVSRPMGPLEMDANGVLWFFTDLRSSKVYQLEAVNLTFTDAARANYVSLSGRGEIDSDRAHIERLWTPMARPWFPDGPDSPTLALLKFVPNFADYWDAPNSRMVRAFGMIASAVTGKPIAMGEHGTHTGLSVPSVPGASS